MNVVFGDGLKESHFFETAPKITTTSQEQALGRAFMSEIRKQMTFVSDPLIVDYVNNLGFRLADNLQGETDSLRFFVINDDLVNAFAGPGNRLAVFTGLMLATRNEAELASVLAHEIAHVAQRHLPRMMQRARSRKLPTTAGVLAAILLGGQVGAAALAATTGAALSDQLKYNREYEREADILAMQILSNAGYPVFAMVTFHEQLSKNNLLRINKTPEYLRTHPFTESRMALIESRLKNYPTKRSTVSLDYYHAKARIRSLFTDNIDSEKERFVHELNSEVPSIARSAQYGLIICQLRQGEYQLASKNSWELYQKFPNYLAYRIVLAETSALTNNLKTGLDILESFQSTDADLPILTYFLSDLLIKNKQHDKARKKIRSVLRQNPELSELHFLLARLEGESGNIARSFQAMGDYYFLIDQIDKSLEELDKALLAADTDYMKSSIKARIKEIKSFKES